MANLLQMIKNNTLKIDPINKHLQSLYEKIMWLKKNEKNLDIEVIFKELKKIRHISGVLKNDLDKIDFDIYDKSLIEYGCKERFAEILGRMENKSKDFDLSIDLAEALKELYEIAEIMENFPLKEKNHNFILNVIYEISLNLEQHFLYHFKEIQSQLE